MSESPHRLPSQNHYLGIIFQLLPENAELKDALARKDAEIARLCKKPELTPEALKAIAWGKEEVARIKADDHYTPEMTADLEALIALAER